MTDVIDLAQSPSTLVHLDQMVTSHWEKLLEWFTQRMLMQMDKNSHKGNKFEDLTVVQAFLLMNKNIGEFAEKVAADSSDESWSSSQLTDMINDCADIANFAAILGDMLHVLRQAQLSNEKSYDVTQAGETGGYFHDEDEEYQEYRKEEGVIASFNNVTFTGRVQLESRLQSFGLTSFYGSRGQTHPDIGQKVIVVFTPDGHVLSVNSKE